MLGLFVKDLVETATLRRGLGSIVWVSLGRQEWKGAYNLYYIMEVSIFCFKKVIKGSLQLLGERETQLFHFIISWRYLVSLVSET